MVSAYNVTINQSALTQKKGRQRRMSKVGQFSKVSLEQYITDSMNDLLESGMTDAEAIEFLTYKHDNIILPKRSTSGSAGYDFYSPIGFELNPGESIKIPTGVRCFMDKDWVLMLYVRSSIGFKYHVVLANGTGIIDSDFYNGSGEGHIFIKLVNEGDKTLKVEPGDRIAQGVFLQYGITFDDDADGVREGGIGSTGV